MQIPFGRRTTLGAITISLVVIAAIAITVITAAAHPAHAATLSAFDMNAASHLAPAIMLSWSFGYAKRADFEADVRPKEYQNVDSPTLEEQIQAGRAAAQAIIDSKGLGDDTNVPGGHRDYSVYIGGHIGNEHPRWSSVNAGVSVKDTAHAGNTSAIGAKADAKRNAVVGGFEAPVEEGAIGAAAVTDGQSDGQGDGSGGGDGDEVGGAGEDQS